MSATVAVQARRQAARRGVNVGAYLAYARLGVQQELDARTALVARAAFMVVILFVFSRLWEVIVSAGALQGRSTSDFLWYLGVTELVILSFPYLHLEIGADVRNGEFVVRLPQPVSYIGARLAEGAGGALVRFLAFAPVVVVAPTVLGGGFPPPPAGLALAIPLAVPAIGLALLFNGAIGLSAVWLHNAEPLSWIWQKLAFLFGGVILPLEVYPEWLRSFAVWTPFAALANGPGRMVLEPGAEAAWLATARLLGWIAVVSAFLIWEWRRAQRALDAHGS